MANVNATIDIKTLKALMLFAGKSDIRFYLNGLHIEQSATGTVAVATNGHVIAIARIDSDCYAPATMIVHRQYIDAIKTKYAVTFTQNDAATVSIQTADGKITMPLVDGRFPDWRRVVSAKQTGEQAYFHPDNAALVERAGQIISKTKFAYLIQQNGNSVGYCNLGSDVHAYVMPLRSPYEDGVVSSPTFA
jgi:DNA polymerase III sliding clamp (beta) subunit (PCNA family)